MKNLLILILIGIPFTTLATESQTMILNILPGNISIVQTPNNFSFGTTFIDHTSTELYKTLSPEKLDNQLMVEDADMTGLNFNITVALSNLIDRNRNQIIPFTNLSLITLSEDSSGIDAVTNNTPPANIADISAPINCAWNNDIIINCQDDFDSNNFTGSSIYIANDPSLTVDKTTNIVRVNDLASYRKDEIIQFSNGEKALITNIILGSGGYLEVKRGILNTSTATHAAESGITRYFSESEQIVVMEGPEPAVGRIGAYSIGFGFKTILTPEFSAGNYSGTITYSLILY
jgi:hypothetical protein